MTEEFKKLFHEVFSSTPAQIGLRQQGHMQTIEKMIAEQKTWDEIGKAIGWDRKTAEQWYAVESALECASLRSQLAACQRELEEARRDYALVSKGEMRDALHAAEQQLAQMKEALKRFTSDFECDFVLDGQIVDEPEKRWSVLPELYQIAARALIGKGEGQ